MHKIQKKTSQRYNNSHCGDAHGLHALNSLPQWIAERHAITNVVQSRLGHFRHKSQHKVAGSGRVVHGVRLALQHLLDKDGVHVLQSFMHMFLVHRNRLAGYQKVGQSRDYVLCTTADRRKVGCAATTTTIT